ncbi:MAG: DUF4231 domain-containing protein [Bacteroidota bacterium]
MDESTYIKERVDDQLGWFEKKSAVNQKRYRFIKILVLLLSAVLPFLAAIDFNTSQLQLQRIIIGVIGIIVAVCEGVLMINKYHEKWVEYRGTAELLKREKLLYLTKSGEYSRAKSPFNTFVVAIESILGEENQSWKKYIAEDG